MFDPVAETGRPEMTIGDTKASFEGGEAITGAHIKRHTSMADRNTAHRGPVFIVHISIYFPSSTMVYY
jgi:hypothetical protein